MMYWVKSTAVNRPLIMSGAGKHSAFLCLGSVSLWSVNFPNVSQGFSLPALGGLSEMQLHISLLPGLLGSDNIRQVRLWFTSFPWKQALLRTSESSGVFQNGSFPPLPSWSMKGFFSRISAGTWSNSWREISQNFGIPLWWGPLGVFNSQPCLHWPSSNLLIRPQASSQHWFPGRSLLKSLWSGNLLFSAFTCFFHLGEWFVLCPSFS